jgi:N6-adenosine-specific RNA methylase IME4
MTAIKIDPAILADLPFEQQAEISENMFRKDWTPSEIGALWRTLEPAAKNAAKEQQRKHGGTAPGRQSGQLSRSDDGRARDKVAAIAGVSGRTLEKIAAVCEAAEAEPERFGKLKADMDRSGRVDGPFKRLKVAIQADAIKREPPRLPAHGPYRVITADPAWPYDKRQDDPSHRGIYSYPQMSIADICALEVGSIAHDDCILWLWTTNYHMREAFDVVAAWGFQQKTILTWVKDKMGRGDWLRGQSEHCLMAVRGKPIVSLTNQTTILRGPVRAHSQKPEQFYQLVESLCPSPRYADLLSRYRHNEKWDCHGDEAPPAAERVR